MMTWLSYLGDLHTQVIDMGLERVGAVADIMNLRYPAPKVITVSAETRYLYLLRSLTKFFAIPGLRLGYLLCGDSHIISNLKAWREPWTINGLAALVGEALLDDEDYIRKTQDFIAAQREYLCNELRQFPLLKIRGHFAACRAQRNPGVCRLQQRERRGRHTGV